MWLDEYERDPLPAADNDFAAADVIVAVKEAEHRPLMEARFLNGGTSSNTGTSTTSLAGPDEAICHLEREIRGLIDRLAASMNGCDPRDECAIIDGMSTARQSAGLLVYRERAGTIEVFLVHPGGPFWRGKDAGAWSIPKGEFAPGEDPLAAAKREFHEETGQTVCGQFTPLRPVRQRGGKTVNAWQIEANVDASNIHSNTFSLEWPPHAGKFQDFPRSIGPAGLRSTPRRRK